MTAIVSLGLAAAPARACVYEPGRVYFARASADLPKGVSKILDFQAEYFSTVDHPGHEHHVWLTAHTDAEGDEDSNLALSQRRAEAVRDYLKHKGIPESRVHIFSLGERAARTRHDDGTPAARDRFVEIEVVTRGEMERRSSNRRCG
jgi:outer membrane protein OmpA-like peptidoglycan-associated protein